MASRGAARAPARSGRSQNESVAINAGITRLSGSVALQKANFLQLAQLVADLPLSPEPRRRDRCAWQAGFELASNSPHLVLGANMTAPQVLTTLPFDDFNGTFSAWRGAEPVANRQFPMALQNRCPTPMIANSLEQAAHFFLNRVPVTKSVEIRAETFQR